MVVNTPGNLDIWSQRREAWIGPVLAVLALMQGACTPNPRPAIDPASGPPVVPSQIVVLPAQITLHAGEGMQLAAQVNDGAGQPIGGAPLTFLSADPSMLRVSDHGALVAIGTAGEARLEVRSGVLTQQMRVRVLPGAPGRIELIEGDNQSAAAGESLPALITVRVADTFGNHLSAAAVQFAVDNATASVQPAEATTDDRGLARGAWTLGHSVGRQLLRATTTGGSALLTVTATASPGRPQQLAKIGGDEAAVVAGAAVTLRAQVQDAFGNAVPATPVQWAAPLGAARLVAVAPETDSSGLIESTLTTPPTIGATDVTASIAAENGRRSVTFAVLTRPGPAAIVAAHAGRTQTARVGQAVPARPAVKVTDANGNPVAGAKVDFAVTQGNGRADGTTQVTAQDGVATVGRWVLGPVAGLNEMQATVQGIASGAEFRATARRPQ